VNRLLIVGACGRMGRLLAGMAPKHGFEPACGVDRGDAAGLAFPVYPDFSRVDVPCDLLIDFSAPEMLPGLLAYAVRQHLPCVLGTTGYTGSDLDAIRLAAGSIPVFHSPNMSRGIYVLRQLAARARALLPGFEIEIIEKHQSQKQDSPSGTALALLDAVKTPGDRAVFGREGKQTRRQDHEIGVHALRGGTVAGDHEVGFYGDYEIITLAHHAQDRGVFAAGALHAAAWLLGKEPGLYGMEDVMGEGLGE